jgi:hypothetical protein
MNKYEVEFDFRNSRVGYVLTVTAKDKAEARIKAIGFLQEGDPGLIIKRTRVKEVQNDIVRN